MLPTAQTIERAVGCSMALARTYEKPLRETCDRYEINTPKRLAAFLAQIGHESGSLGRTVENLNYSAAALVATWPSRFTKVTAEALARKPQQIANRVYGGRLGNGPELTGDGWRYRGRGLIQVTGKANYEAITELLMKMRPPEGIPDFVLHPEQLEEYRWASLSAGAYWDDRELNELADAGDFRKITTRINGGQNGRADREARFSRALKVFN